MVEELGPKTLIKLFLLPVWLVLVAFVGARAVDRVLDSAGEHIVRRRKLSIAGFAVFGLLVPMCECGIVVVMRRLLRRGLPLSACVAYMLAGPIIKVIVILSTFAAFSGP